MKISNSGKEIKKWAEKAPLIPNEEIRILYTTEIYDGPREGIALWKDKKYYFYSYGDIKRKGNDWGVRMFAVIEMTAEQESEAEYWQDQLLKRVGPLNLYDENGEPVDANAKSDEEHENYWEEYQSKLKTYTLASDQIKARWEYGRFSMGTVTSIYIRKCSRILKKLYKSIKKFILSFFLGYFIFFSYRNLMAPLLINFLPKNTYVSYLVFYIFPLVCILDGSIRYFIRKQNEIALGIIASGIIYIFFNLFINYPK